MGRKRERFWEYAKQGDGFHFKCNFCGKEFAGGISRIKSHLSGVKGRDIDICLKVPDHVQADAQQAIGSPFKKGKNVVAISPGGDSEKNVIIQDPSSITVRGSASEFRTNYQLINWCTQDKEVTAYQDGTWTGIGCTLMIIHGEDWYLYDEKKVFACSPQGTLFLTSGPCDTFRDHWVRVIEWIGSHPVVQVIESDAIFNHESVNLIKERHPQVLLTRCPTEHVRFILDNITFYEISNLVGVGIMVFIYMRKYSMEFARKIFDKYMVYKRLRHIPLYGYDDLCLLLSVMELGSEVTRFVQSLDTSSSDLAKWVADVIAGTKFWALGKQVVHTVDVLFQVVRLRNNSKAPAFGYLYEVVNKACNDIDECCGDDPTRYDEIKHYCVEGLRRMITPLHAAASFLNPAVFTSRENFKEDSLMTQGISYIAHDLIVDRIERMSFLYQVQMYRAKVPSIFSAAAVEKLKTVHPGVWWHRFGDSVPVLQKYATRILSQPCGVPLDILHTTDHTRGSKWMKEIIRSPETWLMETIDLNEFTRVSEYVKRENMTCIFKPTKTFEGIFTTKDPLIFWLENKDALRHWDVPETSPTSSLSE